MNTAENRAHWDAQAALGETAGTQDLILKQLEKRALLFEAGMVLPKEAEVLEVGCGHGEMARDIARVWRPVHVTAIDSSEAMIAEARRHQGKAVNYLVGDVMDPPRGPFQLAYSQRCLINLPDWTAQKQAIDAIAGRLVPGGRFLMCEHSQDGLDFINRHRVMLGLPAIEPPWHNRYQMASELAIVTSLRLLDCRHFSATYYYHSRILNAALSSGEPAYDAPINQLALRLTDTVDPRFAQARLWIWERA